jgi:hypothetical protein
MLIAVLSDDNADEDSGIAVVENVAKQPRNPWPAGFPVRRAGCVSSTGHCRGVCQLTMAGRLKGN